MSFDDTLWSKCYINIMEITNTSSEGVVFASPILVTTLFDHHQNNFSLYADGEGSTFPDYDGDGLKENVDPYPTIPGNELVPQVQNLTPAAGAVDVALDAAVSVRFDRPVILVDSSQVSIEDNGGNDVPGSIAVTLEADATTLSIGHPLLENQTAYTVSIPAGTVENADQPVGNDLITWSFTTLADSTPPTVTADPAGGTYDTAQDVTLSMPEEGTIYYTLDGSDPTDASTVYSGTINIGATTTLKFMGVDLAGNQSQIYNEEYVIDMVPTPDLEVVEVNPADGTLDVIIHGDIVFIFSEDIAAGKTYRKITAEDQQGGGISISTQISGDRLTITPESKWINERTYTIILPAGCVDSVSGTALASAYSTRFTTVEGITNAVISPAEDAAVDQIIIIEFDEEVYAGDTFKKIVVLNAGGKKTPVAIQIVNGQLLITPRKGWAADTTYMVILPVGCVETGDGTILSREIGCMFRTVTGQ